MVPNPLAPFSGYSFVMQLHIWEQVEFYLPPWRELRKAGMYHINTPSCEWLLNMHNCIFHSFENIQISKVGKEEKHVQQH